MLCKNIMIVFMSLWLILPYSSYAATPEQASLARKEILEVQKRFIVDAAKATGLSETQITEFLPQGQYYGKNIGEIYSLTPHQLTSLKSVDETKRAQIKRIRETYNITEDIIQSRGLQR